MSAVSAAITPVSGNNSQAPNPLQLGEVLYEVLDVTVIATPNGSSTPHYNRISLSSSGGSVLASDPLTSSGAILDVCASPDPLTGTVPVYTLTADTVGMIGADGPSSGLVWTLSTSGCIGIIGTDPVQTSQRTVLLLGQNSTGAFLLPVTCMESQAAPSQVPVPLSGVAGTATDGLLVRRQLSARVIVASMSNSHLLIYDLGSSALGSSPSAPSTYPSIDLGSTEAGAAIGLTAASVFPGVDQQVAVTFIDSSGAVNLAVLGWDSQGDFALITQWKATTDTAPKSGPALSELVRENGIVRITAGDLVAAGNDQIVVGYAATFANTSGCAALLLFQAQGSIGSPSVTLASTYAAATGDNPPQPLASIDLHLAAGVFGDVLAADTADSGGGGVLGLVVTGCAASASQLFQGTASISTGLVPVSPATMAFPLLNNAPGVPEYLTPVVTVSADTNFILAVPSDVTGQSVILGPPVLSQSLQKGQLLAVIQAPPFELGNSASAPKLTLTRGTTDVQGYNVSSNKTWTFSKDTGGSIGIGPLKLGETISSSYGNGFDNVDNSSTTTSMQVSSTIADNDMVVLFATNYEIWQYPVYRKAKQSTPDGSLAIIFPQSGTPLQTLLPASNPGIGYTPASQIGKLLTYLGAELPGYQPANLVFDLLNYPVTEDAGGTTVTYDSQSMNSQSLGVNYTVQNSTKNSLNFSFDTKLFDYVPVNFGLDMDNGSDYSDNEVTTTSLSHTVEFTIEIASGSVSDIEYEYQVTPYIYQHETMGCLVVGYQVSLNGQGWNSYYSKNPMPLMLVALSNSQNPVLAGFSRDITFDPQEDGSVNITVSIFNNSMNQVTQGVCEFYLGAPELSQDGQAIQPSASQPFQTETVASIDGAARASVTGNAKLTAGSQVTVRIYTSGQEGAACVYWGIYPATAYEQWTEFSAQHK